jgi:hypothetical protein
VRKGVSFHDFTEEIKEQKVACFGKKHVPPNIQILVPRKSRMKCRGVVLYVSWIIFIFLYLYVRDAGSPNG